ncbi:MAG: SDR family NAD(P)-dependent oxidoreductase [Cytophagales bacterium]|nr:MAG: SDR family NAD(P)-dependent oxidoreductase [Cytophagales bacterium]
MQTLNTFYTLITGASEGIGKALAEVCAKDHRNLILVALPNVSLENTVTELKQQFPQIKVEPIGLDLTNQDAAQQVYQTCQENNWQINTLIHNAGFGSAGEFEKYSMSFYEKMIQLHCTFTVALTYYFLPDLKKLQQGAQIVHVSSAAAFTDTPYKLVYSTTKKFILHFARVLQEELRKTKIKVSIVCPPGVATSAAVLERTEDAGWIAQRLILTPQQTAQSILKGIHRKQLLILPGFVGKLFYVLSLITTRGFQRRVLGSIFRGKKKREEERQLRLKEKERKAQAKLMAKNNEIHHS